MSLSFTESRLISWALRSSPQSNPDTSPEVERRDAETGGSSPENVEHGEHLKAERSLAGHLEPWNERFTETKDSILSGQLNGASLEGYDVEEFETDFAAAKKLLIEKTVEYFRSAGEATLQAYNDAWRALYAVVHKGEGYAERLASQQQETEDEETEAAAERDDEETAAVEESSETQEAGIDSVEQEGETLIATSRTQYSHFLALAQSRYNARRGTNDRQIVETIRDSYFTGWANAAEARLQKYVIALQSGEGVEQAKEKYEEAEHWMTFCLEQCESEMLNNNSGVSRLRRTGRENYRQYGDRVEALFRSLQSRDPARWGYFLGQIENKIYWSATHRSEYFERTLGEIEQKIQRIDNGEEELPQKPLDRANMQIAFLYSLQGSHKEATRALKEFAATRPGSSEESRAARAYRTAESAYYSVVEETVQKGIERYGERGRSIYESLARRYGRIEPSTDYMSVAAVTSAKIRLAQLS